MIIIGVFFLAIILIAIMIWSLISDKGSKISAKDKQKALTEQAEKHRANIAKVLNMAQISDKITNNDIERTLGVSDSTATRYLQELEEQGKIEQVGEEGRAVFYRGKHF
ncbi:MAG: winged helix-turn-helix transcriptional regulator [bacterium]|nr:winged helix-turn-helix transcriptional regulator [bacterium]